MYGCICKIFTIYVNEMGWDALILKMWKIQNVKNKAKNQNMHPQTQN